MAVNDKAFFYYRSYCDQDLTGYAFSGDFTNNSNVNDRNKLTYAITSGEDTDGDSVDYIVDLGHDRDIDTIVLKSNLKTFTIYIWDENETGTGGAGYVALQAYASNTDGFILLEFPEVVTSKVKITATHTIVADQEKQINILELTKKITEMYVEDITIEKAFEKANFNNVYGGSVQVVKYPNHGKVDIDLDFGNLTNAEFVAYNLLKAQSIIDSFAIYLYFSDTYTLLNVEAYYLVNDVSDYKHDPASPALSAGISGSLKLREV